MRVNEKPVSRSFGVPHIVINNPLHAAKFEGYVHLAGLENFRITDLGDLEACFERLTSTPREDWTAVASG